MGTTVLLGKKIGSRDCKGATDTIGTSICVFTLLGIVLSIVMIFTAPKIAVIMNAPQEAFEKTVHYILICGAGSLFIVGYNLISAIFHGMGTAGAAIATIAAQGISVVLSLVLIKKKGLSFPFGKGNIRLIKETAANIIKLGFPIALQNMCNEISYLIIIGLVNALGVTASTGVGIAKKLVMFMLLIPMSYMQSICFCCAKYWRKTKSTRKKGNVDRNAYCCSLWRHTVLSIFFHGDLFAYL